MKSNILTKTTLKEIVIKKYTLVDKVIHCLLNCFAYMNNKTKIKIIQTVDSKKFYRKIFTVWAKNKSKFPNLLICFWCGKHLLPKEYFKEKINFFKVTIDGVIFETPTYGKDKFNNMYKDTYTVELCDYCYYNLDMFNKTGLWFDV